MELTKNRDMRANLTAWIRSPILVRELRSTFRGWRFFASHSILLSVFGLILLIALVMHLGDPDPNPTMVGRMVFSMLFVFQALLVGVVLPAFGCTAVAGEREKKSFDLLLTTTLTPAEIIWGKFTASMMYSFLFLISALPLVSIAFLFGGVSLVDLAASYAFLFASSFLLNLYAVFISAAVKTSQRAIIVCYLFLIPLGIALIAGALDVVGAYTGGRYVDRIFDGRGEELTFEFKDLGEAVLRVGVPAFSYCALLTFFFLAGTARLKAPTANRSTSFRVWYAGFLSIAVALSVWLIERAAKGEDFETRLEMCRWLLFGIGGAGLFSLLFAGEEPVLPLRLRGQVGKMKGVLRALRPFMPGSANGAAYCVIVNGLALAATLSPLYYGVLAPESMKVGRAIAVPITAACILAFLFLIACCGVLLSTLFRTTATAKGALGLTVTGFLLVPLIVWVVAAGGHAEGVPLRFWLAGGNLPLVLATVWDGLGERPVFPFAFHAFGRAVPYAAFFCGLYLALGTALLAWGMTRRSRLTRMAESGPLKVGA